MEDGSKFSIHSICRVCLKQLKDETSYDLFFVPGLVKKFCICTSLSVEPQDGYPKNICGVCHTRLNELHDFQKQCVDSVQKFQEMVAANNFSVDLMEGIEGGDDDLNPTQDDDGDQLNFDPLFSHKLELVENDEDVIKMLENESKEKIDDTTMEEKNPFDEKDFYSNDSSSSESDNDDDFFGGGAAQESSASSESDDDKPLAFRKCAKSKDKTPAKPEKPKRKRIPAAERHLHRIIECHICHQKFKKNVRYQEHMKYHNDKLPHQCKVETCRKGFTTESSLRQHVEHSHAETLETFECPEEGCDRTFLRKGLLTWHLKKIHNIAKVMHEPRSFPCTECEKVFRCPMALKKHTYKHTGEELPFQCNICSKRFVTNSVLKDHLVRHAGIKNFVCPYCGVGKTTRQELNKHINTHTQEKQFKCDQCAYGSHNKQDLQRHVKVVHLKIKDYACNFCGKTFGKSHACKMHEMTHTGEKRCECKVCGKQFLYAKGLTRHLQTHEKRVQRSIDTYRERNANISATLVGDQQSPLFANQSKDSYANAAEDLLKVCAESLATVPRDQRRVERVDMSQLAGTAINPIPSVSVSSWSPQLNQSMVKESQQHICPDCGQGFNWIGNLKSHQRIVHEGVKDFACRFCERRFAKARTLKDHEMIHTGEKPHQCTQCSMRFIKIDALKRHMKVHLKNPPVSPTRVAAACEELVVLEFKERSDKRANEENRQAIAEAAREQLIEMKKQHDELRTY